MAELKTKKLYTFTRKFITKQIFKAPMGARASRRRKPSVSEDRWDLLPSIVIKLNKAPMGARASRRGKPSVSEDRWNLLLSIVIKLKERQRRKK